MHALHYDLHVQYRRKFSILIVVLWMAVRYLVGDGISDKLFKFEDSSL
jgi:hypothetical protein